MSFSNVEKEFLRDILAGYEDNSIAVNILKKLDEKKCNKKANEVIKKRTLKKLENGIAMINLFSEKFTYRNISRQSGLSYETIKKLLPNLNIYHTDYKRKQYVADELKLSDVYR